MSQVLSLSEEPPAQRTLDIRRVIAGRVIVASTVTAVVLVPVRAKTVGFWFVPTLLAWRDQLPLAVATAVFDVAFVTGLTALVLGALWLPAAAPERRARRVWTVHLGLLVFVVTAGVANIPVVAWLGQPFTYQWLMYSDFLRSGEAILAIFTAVPWWQVLLGMLALGGFGSGLAWLAQWGEQRMRTWPASARRRLACWGTVGLAGYLVSSHLWLAHLDWSGRILTNPVWAFAKSCVIAVRSPGPFVISTPVKPEDFLPPPPATGQPASTLPAVRPVTRNVILFVLESVASCYVGLHGSEYGVTPELDRRREHAMIFTDAYAHAPATNLTLIALFNGIYPRVSFRLTTSENPEIKLPGIGGMLRARGYASAFFATAPLNYHQAGEFLAASGDFDYIEDSRNRRLPPGVPPAPWSELAGTTDRATVESAIAWMEARGETPLFVTIWTNQTHFPYQVAGQARPLSANADFNRYLNGLAEIDAAFGRLMGWLEETGRAAETLVVVLGDHGEAFGQHGNYGHAGHVFDENVRIPLALIQPGLFHGEVNDTVCGIVDLAPTLAEILRLPPDPAWQGRSLFSTQRTGRVYFFAAWSDFLMGYREGRMKKVYNAANDTHIVFDLAADPDERHNLASGLDEEARRGITHRIAAWVQHIERVYQPLLAE